MPQEDKRAGSRFWAFWSSLPGVLTGVAAVLAAVATLAALFMGDGGGSDAPGAVGAEPGAVGAEPSTVPGVVDEDCFSTYFKGIPDFRLGTVEAGAYVDVLSETEPKAGQIGITFTDFGRLIGGIRFIFIPENTFFKIESIVDARCGLVEEYENRETGNKRDWPDSTAVRIRLGDQYYDLTANGAGSIVRVGFASVTP